MSTRIEIFCDGACSGNPGPGGFGALLRCGPNVKEISGGELLTTNNRMELTAAISALDALNRKCSVTVTTDSQYLVKGMKEWLLNWKKRGWVNSKKEPVLNRDLWERLDILSECHDIRWEWVRGHSGHAENERCDEMARAAIVKMLDKREFT